MESRPPQLSLDELHLLRWLLGGVLMLLSVATVFYLDIDSEVVAAVAAAGILAALVWPTLPALVPIWAHRLAFPAILAFFAGDLWHSGQLLPSIVRLDLLLLLYRGVSHRARRDDLQIVVLGLFLVVVAGVLTVSLLFAAQILVFTACSLGLLMVVTIAASTEGGQAPKLAVRGVSPLWASHADWRRLFGRLWEISDWRLLTSAAALFLGVVALSGLLFLAIPRFQLENSLFLERFVFKRAMTGFNDSIKFGDITEITQDDSIAFNVDVSDPPRRRPFPTGAWWCSTTIQTGVSASPEGSGGCSNASAPRRTSCPTGGRPRRPDVDLLPRVGGQPLPPHPRPVPRDAFPRRPTLQLLPCAGLCVASRRARVDDRLPGRGHGARGRRARRPPFARAWASRGPVALPLQIDLKISTQDAAAVSRLAAEFATPGIGAEEFAQRAVAALRRAHRYSLAPHIPAGPGDPLVRWMTSVEPGHCELFAGAFVLLARSGGFPARVITGFKGGTWNAYSNNYTIRNSDAHAWAEIWDARRGAWLREDPLAAAVSSDPSKEKGDAALAGLMDRSWSARLNSLRVFWYRRIVNFDQQSQADTLNAVKSATDGTGKWLRAGLTTAARRIKAWVKGPWNWARILRVAAGSAAAAAICWLVVRGRWRLMSMARGRRVDPVRREAGRWLVRLDGPDNLVADLQRLRYGPAPTWPRPSEVFRRARQAASSAPRRRRASSRSTS